MSGVRHFLRDDDLTTAEQAEILDLALDMKADPLGHRPLAGGAAAILFDKPSTRTRVSFSIGVWQLGGYPLVLDPDGSQLGRGEGIGDTMRVLQRQVDLVVWRTFGQARIEELTSVATVPVINGLTDEFHPCQILADLLTLREHHGQLPGLTLAYLGDCANNMAQSYALGGAVAGLHVRLAGPADHHPDPAVLHRARHLAEATGGSVTVGTDPHAAADGADAIATDTWVSMGMEQAKDDRMGRSNPFATLRVDEAVMARTAPGAVFLHCLPAYRGYEVTAEVLDGPASVVWDEAENRLHAQKALMAFLLAASGIRPGGGHR
ncbi:MAG TPA: ornithine carbamoyltransferase [Dermatophilaceae bacterium]|nr:ornithine carbamoyltransferase [Dermatophilaceae bacterium]